MQTKAPPAIQTEKLTLRYDDLTAVDRVDLFVPSGSVYGFLGLNGAGKTSTIRMLLGLIRPNAGEIRLFNERFSPSNRKLLRRVGALVEEPSLYTHLTGRENLELTRVLIDAAPAGVERALAIVGLEKDGHRAVREYSQGMRQRLGLALALLGDPQLLILDEPTNG
ncbi:MAG TPA: ATP-binding cassette domain-containing protein, partial [Aggregatilineales bacterium]|nr:ATP-binding cassette domain-containing protein [Aggregatilineales bacterium]